MHPDKILAFLPVLARPREAVAGLLLLLLIFSVGCGQAGAGDKPEPDGGAVVPEAEEEPPPTGYAGVVTPLEIDDLQALPGPSPGQVLLSFRTPLEKSRADALLGFLVRAQISHITIDNVGSAPAVENVVRTTDSDGTERLLLSGLEAGRVLQFTVQARRSKGLGPAAPAVTGRVPAPPGATPPANAIRISAPRELGQEGGYYLLTKDVVASGTAFRITARGVTLDLGGYTITYGADQDDTHGVSAEYLYDRGTTTVLNGVIRQVGVHSRCDAIRLRGGHDVRISRIVATVQGPDCDGIDIWDGLTGDLRVDHCTIACNTTVVTNRHYPGVCALRVEGSTHSTDIASNLITASPQWGIKVAARETRGELLVHHNRILGTRARVANGYMIGIHQPQADVFENELVGESRGIHLDGVDAHGHGARIHDNFIRAQDQPNAEFPQHWCHGIKVEGPSSALIYDNHVWVGADEGHSEARALDVSLPGSQSIVIAGNRFAGVSSTKERAGLAIGWTDGFSSGAGAAGLRVERNVFRATDRFIQRDWESRSGGTMRGNLWVRDLSQGAAHPFVFERFDNEEGVPSRGHRYVDYLTMENALRVSQWANPGPYESDRVHTVRIRVHNARGDPVSGAAVQVHDASDRRVLSLSTGLAGVVEAELLMDRITFGPTVSSSGPFKVQVTKDGIGSYAGTFEAHGRFALRVDLEAGRAEADLVAPPAPVLPRIHVLSGTRIWVRWRTSGDDSGIAAYIIYLDGEPAAVCTTTACVLAGLTPGKTHDVALQAVDCAGHRSVISEAERCLMRSEDRGP